MKGIQYMLLFFSATIVTIIAPEHLVAAIAAYGLLVGVPTIYEIFIEGLCRLARYHHKDETPLLQSRPVPVYAPHMANANEWPGDQ